ncbi:thioesterase [Flavobacterium branchiophilum]|uniref:Acyl-CoA thioesterase n=1 Tax=Flavobacterium branchiophilum TaxID=55197 RepID=A0A543G7F7_9FLAO|nr:hotdog fold thioesterase [Flavobacterium branchiophilum]OXA71976.1 thioesterase [Flavobacterium branchiophilum] [Flavobacterium branchiophilum NBRC 15030 = ATCC 35035]TQM42015.1 acyl-CoA thioesterase [Flavobacterium branchiophilum]GEM53786.1 acyl-CoA thioesterase [Flavobacterium branchiophilum NBRC 15030 = ATCC 35035]
MNSSTIPHKMLSQDAFSQWLGITILESEIGKCKVGMTVRKDMLNSMGKAHGGITFALADTAFGFAANALGKYAVSIETSINHIEAVNEGDYLTAVSVIEKSKNKLGFHIIEVRRHTANNQEPDELVALFKGVVFRTQKDWEI